MFRSALALSSLALMTACTTTAEKPAATATPAAPATASATLISATGVTVGNAALVQTVEGIAVTVALQGLQPGGTQAVHIHAVGLCDGPAFTTAGGHWNPYEKQHGMDNPAGSHGGDMPNVKVAADGTANLSFLLKGFVLNAGDHPLLDADGAAVVVHAGADDYKTDPAGAAGARIACGVVKG